MFSAKRCILKTQNIVIPRKPKGSQKGRAIKVCVQFKMFQMVHAPSKKTTTTRTHTYTHPEQQQQFRSLKQTFWVL